MENKINIAIDGPAASGKSSTAKKIADIMGIKFIDTGLMYRAFAFFCLKNKVNFISENDIIEKLSQFHLELKSDSTILINDIIINKNILTSNEVSSIVTKVTCIQKVRFEMVKMQKDIIKNKGCIMVGRDIGTVVMPHADIKFFLTSSVEERAKRRYEQSDKRVNLDTITSQLNKRDKDDKNRKISPLIAAKDAIIMDNTSLSFDETVKIMIEKIKKG